MSENILDKLRSAQWELQMLHKEIMSNSVPGIEIVREDLGVRTKEDDDKDKHMAAGQVHKQPVKRPSGSMTSGQGKYSHSELPLTSTPTT